MKKSVSSVAIGVFVCVILVDSLVALAVDAPCRQELLNICKTNPEGNPICQILKKDAIETPETIVDFILAIQPLNSEQQERMICARLLGRKTLKLGWVDPRPKSDSFPGCTDGWWSEKDYHLYTHVAFRKSAQPVQNYDYYHSVSFRFAKISEILGYWFMIRKVNPFDNEVMLITTVDISDVKVDGDMSIRCLKGPGIEIEIKISHVLSTDSQSDAKIQARMNQVLNIGLENKASSKP